MTNSEMVELLSEKANISREDAQAALEQSNWDLLDAMLLLERQGKVDGGSEPYSTKHETQTHDHQDSHWGARNALRWSGQTIVKLVRTGNANHFVISHQEKELLVLPVTAFVVLLIFTFWFSLIALAIGLFCGLRYSFRGPNLGKQSINDVIERAADMADSVREDLLREQHAPTDEEE